MVGETLGSWRIVRQLGEGGMGIVYQAEHALIGRQAAVKVLRKDLSFSKDIIGRFFNEARATAAIRHSGLVDVLDFGYAADGSAYLVMEFLDGMSLGDRVGEGLPAEMALSIARQVASAVGAAHVKGIVHRDLKPDNILLIRDDQSGGLRAKVLDFGIAKLAGDAQVGMVKTQTGSTMGTPLYMSPEQCRGLPDIDARADVYSLGCILFEMLAGRLPFDGDTPSDVMAAHLRDKPPALSTLLPSIPAALDALVMSMLAKKPAERPASMEQVISAVDRLGARTSIPHIAHRTGKAERRPSGFELTEISGVSQVGVQPAVIQRSSQADLDQDLATAMTMPPNPKTPAGTAAAPAGATGQVSQVSSKDPRQTTFGSSVGESIAWPPKRRKPWLVPVVIATAAVAAIGIILIARGPKSSNGNTQPAAASQPSAAPTPSVPVPVPVPVPDPPPVLAATRDAGIPEVAKPVVKTTPKTKPPAKTKTKAKKGRQGGVDFEDGALDPFAD